MTARKHFKHHSADSPPFLVRPCQNGPTPLSKEKTAGIPQKEVWKGLSRRNDFSSRTGILTWRLQLPCSWQPLLPVAQPSSIALLRLTQGPPSPAGSLDTAGQGCCSLQQCVSWPHHSGAIISLKGHCPAAKNNIFFQINMQINVLKILMKSRVRCPQGQACNRGEGKGASDWACPGPL